MDKDTEYDRSRLEKLKRGLYKTEKDSSDRIRHELSPSDVSVENDWGDTEIITNRPARVNTGVTVFLKGLVVLAVLTSFVSGGYLLYQYFDPLGKPSDKNIIITFETPVGVTPGIAADLTVHVSNQNRVGLEYANLSVLYPSGTRSADNPDKDLRDPKKLLGEIAPGETADFKTRAIFLGEENTEKEVRAVLEYRFKGINSVFTKESARPLRMLAAPVNLTVNTLKEINAGQQVDLTVTAVSNTVIPLRDLYVKVEYPQGFTYQDADPKPTFGTNMWKIGQLQPGDKYPLKIRGVLEGSDTQQKVFHTTVGVGSDKTERDIATSYARVASEITIKRPFIGIQLAINDKPAGDAVAQYGTQITGRVDWQNNLPTRITNAQIEVRLRGVLLDRSSVVAGTGGFYRSIDDTIFWDERGNDALSTLESGKSGSVSFSFKPLPPVSGNQVIATPMLSAEVTVRGKRMSDANVPEEIKTVMSQNVRIASEAQFAARSTYYVGPFTNTGPIPPRVEQETTYTITWTIVNTSSGINNTQVHGLLPSYVRWYGSVSPSKEKIVYDRNTNQVIWQPGDIPAGTGISLPPKEVSFQVVLLPSLSQLHSPPVLMSNMEFTATDSFTNTPVKRTVRNVSTVLSTDPKAIEGTSDVVE